VNASYTVIDIVDRVAATTAGHDRVAITCAGEDRTFGQLRDRSLALAAGLRTLGVSPGEKVAVLMGNRHEWPELLFGITAAGAVCVPVNVLLRGTEIAHVLRGAAGGGGGQRRQRRRGTGARPLRGRALLLQASAHGPGPRGGAAADADREGAEARPAALGGRTAGNHTETRKG
jgi:hypothetical protein